MPDGADTGRRLEELGLSPRPPRLPPPAPPPPPPPPPLPAGPDTGRAWEEEAKEYAETEVEADEAGGRMGSIAVFGGLCGGLRMPAGTGDEDVPLPLPPPPPPPPPLPRTADPATSLAALSLGLMAGSLAATGLVRDIGGGARRSASDASTAADLGVSNGLYRSSSICSSVAWSSLSLSSATSRS